MYAEETVNDVEDILNDVQNLVTVTSQSSSHVDTDVGAVPDVDIDDSSDEQELPAAKDPYDEVRR
ncbi:unnamed protein product, partial [Didymodactylos carnosus]